MSVKKRTSSSAHEFTKFRVVFVLRIPDNKNKTFSSSRIYNFYSTTKYADVRSCMTYMSYFKINALMILHTHLELYFEIHTFVCKLNIFLKFNWLLKKLILQL